VKNYIGAIDQGTTSTRFMVFDQSARIAAVVQKEHEQILSKPGWVEHDPLEILRRTEEVIADALEQRGLRASDLAAIGITNQRETTVLWERKTGKPVANAVVWQDMRVADDVARFASEGGQDRFRPQTGLPLSTYFSSLKIRWLLDQGITTALWGARHPDQLEPVDEVTGWWLDAPAKAEVDRILRETITDPIGPEFMAPPARSVAA